MSITLECKIDDLKAAIKHLQVALPKSKKERAKAILEINFKPKEVQLSVIGATYRIGVESDFFGKVLIPFVFIEKTVKDSEEDIFTAIFDKGVVKFRDTTLSSAAIKIVHPENQPKIDLPMNYTDLELLGLEFKYSYQELGRMNLLEKIDKAKEQLAASIRAALTPLKMYGIKYEDIEKIVRERIRSGK